MSSQTNTTKKSSKKLKGEEFEVLGLDIGSAFIRASVVSGKNIVASFETHSNGVQNGYVSDADAFQKDVTGLILKINSSLNSFPKRIVVGIATRNQNSTTSNASIITGRSDGIILENDINECVDKARSKIEINKNLEIIHTIVTKKIVDENVIHGEIVGLSGHKIELKVLFIYEDAKNQKTIYEVFEKIGLEIDQIVSGPFAESLVAMTKKDLRLGSCSLNIGLNNTSLVVYENNYPLLCSVIGGGGENVTSDLSLGLRVSYQEAEEMKCDSAKTELSKRRTEEIVEARINYLNNKINEELKRIRRSELLPGGMIISGGTSNLNKIEQYLRYDLKIPTTNILKKISNNELSTNPLLTPENIRSYGIAMLYDKSNESSIYTEYLKKLWNIVYYNMKKYLP